MASKARNIHYLALYRKSVTSALEVDQIPISYFARIFHRGVAPGAGSRRQRPTLFFVMLAATHDHCPSVSLGVAKWCFCNSNFPSSFIRWSTSEKGYFHNQLFGYLEVQVAQQTQDKYVIP